MKFQRAHLHHLQQAGRGVRVEIVVQRALVFPLEGLCIGAETRAYAALIKPFAGNSFRAADERQGMLGDVAQQERRNQRIVFRQLDLGEAGCGIDDPIRMGDGDALKHRIIRLCLCETSWSRPWRAAKRNLFYRLGRFIERP